jgi:hypothetical protein
MQHTGTSRPHRHGFHQWFQKDGVSLQVFGALLAAQLRKEHL